MPVGPLPSPVPPPAEPPPAEPPPAERRIDELARLAGTTVRNVRAYQDRGLLPPPRRQGRVGLYDDAHLARLRLIGALLGRGYTLGNIAELIAGWEQGRDLGDVLGFGPALFGDPSADAASTLRRDQLDAFLGRGRGEELLAEAARRRLVDPDGDVVRADNPALLEGAAVLVEAGVPVAEALQLGTFLAEAVDGIAERYADLVARYDGDRRAELARRLRPLARHVVDAHLALAIERRLGDELGTVTPPG